jgi:hypothetical protein
VSDGQGEEDNMCDDAEASAFEGRSSPANFTGDCVNPCGQTGRTYQVAVNIEANMISTAQRLHGLFLNFA